MRISRRLSRLRRWRYRRALWRAINDAVSNPPRGMYKSRMHPIVGLRAVRLFEEVNGVPFDPHNWHHCMKLCGARHWEVAKQARRILEKHKAA